VLKGLLAGLVLGVVVLVMGFWLYFAMGFAPVATTDPPMPFEKKLAGMALQAYLGKQKPVDPPVPADETNLIAGARVYKQNCAVCHGLPGKEPTAIASGMYPPPPKLLVGKGVTDDPAWESYWKAANGIRMTGMPGFRGKLLDTQLWQVSQLLAHADTIQESVKKALSEEPQASK
jgi:thiosulfate dehydrogenase